MAACRQYLRTFLILSFVIFGLSSANAQKKPPQAQPVAVQELDGPVQPDTIAARKAAVQARIESLGEPDPQKTEQSEIRTVLTQILSTLTAIEETVQKSATYTSQIAELPKRLRELDEESHTLRERGPTQFPQVTEQLRDQYQTQIQSAQAEIQDLIKQTVAGEVRLASIPKELEQRTQARARLESDLAAARGKIAEATSQDLPALRTELLSLQIQLQNAEIEALQTERDWLIRRIPLQDALLKVAQIRLERLQHDLDAIKQALGQAIQQEQATLSDTAADITQQMEQAMDPTNALVLGISLETVEIRRTTAEYRQQLNELSEEVLTQEKQNTQVTQNIDRLTALVEKYASGEVPAQRLVVLLERLQRERARYSDTPVTVLRGHLRVLNEQLFALEDQLYEFDNQAQSTISDLTALLHATPEETTVAEVRQLLDEQKAALRDQQQVLASLVQDVTRLLTLHREYKRQLDESYFLALNRMFWLRDGEPLSWATLQDMVAGVIGAGRRLATFAFTAKAQLQAKLLGDLRLWVGIVLVFLVLPWVAYRLWARLKAVVRAFLATTVPQKGMFVGVIALLIALRSVIWPAYIVLVTWLYERFLDSAEPGNVAAVRGLQITAVVLWVALLGRGLLKRGGWAQQFLELSPELCRSLRRAVFAVCLAALVCMVPRYILLASPGATDTVSGSVALARILLLTFQGVVLVVTGIVARRGGPLMQTILAKSWARDGFIWYAWPFIYVALLGGLTAVIALDMLGYRYAAEFLWLRATGSLTVLFVVVLCMTVVVPWALGSLPRSLFPNGRDRQSDTATGKATNRLGTFVLFFCNALLVLIAAGGILEIWGLSVSWMLALPTVSEFLSRLLVIVAAVGMTLIVLQVSRALTEYLLQPKSAEQGVTREAGRKVKTLAPLVQTVIRVVVIFIAVLVVLEQLGVNTGPVLAGVGIFGLAIGFASQSLIKDVINGLFVLFEDSFSVGDVVTLRGIGGQVEKFTLRAVTLRDLSGNVHVIPNSSFDMVTNFTKDYSRYVLDVSVAYREDVDTVVNILKEIDEDMRHDPAYGLDMLEPIEILGLDRFEDSSVVVRARLKTRPIQQWRIGREFQRRMKKVFDERGIEIPFPHRTLYWGTPKAGAQPSIHVAVENHKAWPGKEEEL